MSQERHETTKCLAEYILNEKPEIGDEFIVRVLHGNNDPSSSVPWARVYIRRSGKDCETIDFRIDYEGEERAT